VGKNLAALSRRMAIAKEVARTNGKERVSLAWPELETGELGKLEPKKINGIALRHVIPHCSENRDL
jgi:hypothetical protein